MTFLLDVNVLIALIDPTHVNHDIAHHWFAEDAQTGWATCPLTENGVVRIVSHPGYPNSSGTPALVADIVSRLKMLPGYRFWPDNISLLDLKIIDTSRLLSHSQVTDSYLLALACANNGQLATFDRRLIVDAVVGGAESLRIIDLPDG